MTYLEKILKESNMSHLLNDLAFEIDLPLSFLERDFNNVEVFKRTLVDLEHNYKQEIAENTEAQKYISDLKVYYVNLRDGKSILTKQEIKDVWLMIRNGDLEIKGSYDDRMRFWVKDGELLSNVKPSIQYKNRMKDEAKKAYFIKAIADKYNCTTKDELIACFSTKIEDFARKIIN